MTYILKVLEGFLKSFGFRDLFYLIVIGLVMFSTTLGSCNHRHTTLPITPKIEQTQVKVDKNGNKYEQLSQYIYTKEDMKSITDSLKKVYKQKHITSVTTGVTQVSSISSNIDTHKDLNGNIVGKNSTKDYQVTFGDNLTTNKANIKVDITNDTTQIISTFKRHLFRPDENTIIINHSNKLFQTISGSSYTQSIPRSIIDLDVSVGYDILHNRAFLGIGVGFNVITLVKSKK